MFKGVMHCYSGSLEMAKEFIKLGMDISFAGPVTFKNAHEPKEVAANIPSETLLVETDAPYLAPQPFRGTTNESKYIPFIVREIAQLLKFEQQGNRTDSYGQRDKTVSCETKWIIMKVVCLWWKEPQMSIFYGVLSAVSSLLLMAARFHGKLSSI